MVASLERFDHRIGHPVAPLGRSSEPPGIWALAPGQVAGLDGGPGSGMTRLGWSLLAPHAQRGQVAYVDVRGWMNPAAAWESGIAPDRLVVVRCDDVTVWGRVMGALVAGVHGLFAEVPAGVRDPVLRTVGARARTSGTPVILRPLGGALPGGLAHLRIEARSVAWDGVEGGHGHLRSRRMGVEASGKAARGMQQTIEVVDGQGAHDVRLVSGVGAPSSRRLA